MIQLDIQNIALHTYIYVVEFIACSLSQVGHPSYQQMVVIIAQWFICSNIPLPEGLKQLNNLYINDESK